MNLEKFFSKEIDRREFLLRSGKVALAISSAFCLGSVLSSCATYNPYTSPPGEFSIEKFDRWFRRKKLYNKNNPNLDIWNHSTFAVFELNFYSGWTPGITYSVHPGDVMVAVAPGEVMMIKELRTGRAGGMMVTVLHPCAEYSVMRSYYAH